ncbi:MAG: TRAP transporter large permease [Rhodospirillales bacterium]|nr:TRAP transporter large permease [Rhodospirillales bacterium]
MDPLALSAIGIGGMFLLIALHVPIGFAMGIAGIIGVGVVIGWGPAISLLKTEPSAVISNRDLAVIPLFLLMGSFATAAGLSSDLYRLAYAFVGHRRGGLAMSTIGGCAGFGAICGSSLATAATMTRVALPEMLKRQYSPQLATGCIAAGGTLGMLIPPSVIMVLYAVLTEQFVITLFVAAIIPGLVAVLFHLFAIAAYVRYAPDAGPAGPRMPWEERLEVFRQSWGVVFLAFVVSGGIYGGIFTVAEAAAVGASLAFLFTVQRRRLTWPILKEVLRETASSTGLIYLIIIGAHIFSYFIALSELPHSMIAAIKVLDLHPMVVMFALYVVYLILGSVFDTIAAMVITLPFVFPLILDLGFDPIWFGVINVMVIEIGLITPPIGMNVFVLQGVARDIPINTVYRGIVPFLVVDLMRLVVLTVFPGLALWLPTVLEFPM